ncbi:MAG: hypothetical protein QF590_00175 [Dehalococcoidia bacterium]|nr:hypothetical protein [Dehalococcoidia bacterium]MDP7089700.1 hypothetical protein [Dehalococcoidia bacterium]MDP7262748.1 hypothetical protein [Dehalococcoidia bacterium]
MSYGLRQLLHPLTWLEHKALFFPEHSFRGTPEHVGLEYDDIFPIARLSNSSSENKNTKLHGWHMPDTSDVV